MSRLPPPRKWQAPEPQRGASTRRFAAAILRAALDQATGNLPGALESDDPEYVHQLRVGLRRYRSALRLFRDLLRAKARKRLGRAAREAMRPLGGIRDWDVCLAWLLAAKAPERVLARARRRCEAPRRSLAAPDLSWLQLPAGAWRDTDEPLGRFRERALRKARRKVAKCGERLDWRDAAQRHRLRIAVKRLRYAADFLGADPRAIRTLQDSLGVLNDLAVIRGLLEELAAPAMLERRRAAAERRLIGLARRQVAALKLED